MLANLLHLVVNLLLYKEISQWKDFESSSLSCISFHVNLIYSFHCIVLITGRIYCKRVSLTFTSLYFNGNFFTYPKMGNKRLCIECAKWLCSQADWDKFSGPLSLVAKVISHWLPWHCTNIIQSTICSSKVGLLLLLQLLWLLNHLVVWSECESFAGVIGYDLKSFVHLLSGL